MNWPFTVNHLSAQAIGLDAWWPCISPSGHRIYDLVGGHHAVSNLGNLVWTVARPYGFTTPRLSSLGLQAATYTKALGDFTVTHWMYSEGVDNVFDRIYDKDQSTGFIFQLVSAASQTYRGVIRGSNSTSITLPFSNVYFVAMRRIGGNASILIDGGRIKTDWSPGSTTTSTHNLVFGSNQGFSNTFGGNLWDMRVYSRGLSDSEILAMYNTDTRFDLFAPLGVEAIGTPADAVTPPPPTTGNSQVIWFM